MRDRCRYLHWLFKAKKRFGLCVLDYMVTSNHIHLLVKDTAPNVIAQSMQLIAELLTHNVVRAQEIGCQRNWRAHRETDI